jgi:hypothetical protein
MKESIAHSMFVVFCLSLFASAGSAAESLTKLDFASLYATILTKRAEFRRNGPKKRERERMVG